MALESAVKRGTYRGTSPTSPIPDAQARSLPQRAGQVLDARTGRRVLNRSRLEPDRLHALWFLLATTGLRRSETLALRWSDVDLETARVTIRRTVTVAAGVTVWQDDAKSDDSERTIALDTRTVAVVRQHREGQLEEQAAWGPAWSQRGRDRDLVFTRQDGSAIPPKRASQLFTRRVDEIGLPRIGVHGLRHTWATLALRAGVPLKVVSERIGHADPAVTMQVYAHALEGDDTAAAEITAAAIFGD